MMRIGPGGPLKTDLVSSSNDSMSFGIRCIQMADNVIRLVSILIFFNFFSVSSEGRTAEPR